jgi:hypothetical protein
MKINNYRDVEVIFAEKRKIKIQDRQTVVPPVLAVKVLIES